MLTATAVSWVSSLTSHLRVCDTVACRPLEPTDAPIVLTVLLAAGLMLPDLKRFKIGPDGIEAEPDPDRIRADEDLQPQSEQLSVKEVEFLSEIRRSRGDS